MPPEATTPRQSGLSRFYKGPPLQGGLGEYVRGLIRAGRAATRGEKIRWEENRNFYRGEQWIRMASDQRSVAALARNLVVPPGRPGHNAYNRYRAMINARISLLAGERPPYEVDPEDNDQDSIDAARQAEKFIGARWGRSGWNIKHRIGELAKNGDIDGLAYLFAGWDPNAGSALDQPIATRMDGTPITTREDYEALKAMDPNMESLWTMGRSTRPIGDVVWRVVLPGAMSVDPFAIRSIDDARWVCESRVLPRKEVERRTGRDFKEMVADSAGEQAESVQYEDLQIDDGAGNSTISERSGVVVHYFYAKPQPDWPNGVFVEFLDRAPRAPLTATAWQDDLPYFAYTPSPDSGNFIRSRGVGDDLKPIQRDYNQTLRDLRLWLNKVATAPVGLPRGSLMSKSFYNEDGYYEYHPSLGEPRQTQVPSEPTAVFTNNLIWMAGEMERISGVSAIAQGQTGPNSPESAVGINLQIQQTEQNLSETEQHLVDAIEWGCNRSLRLVRDNYDIPRTVTGVGVDDAEQFKAFVGSMLRGGRFRVVGPLMPKSKASRIQSIFQFAPILGEKIAPYVGQFIDGDTSEFMRDVELDRQHQKSEIRDLMALVTDQMAKQVYANFEEDKREFAKAFNLAAQQAAARPPDPMTGQPATPIQVLGEQGILPPNLTNSIQSAGIDIPLVEPEHDNHMMELKACNDFRKGDAYKALHPMAKQLLREHMEAHVQGMRSQVQAMAMQQPVGQQQGSAPAEKGTPSPPKSQPAQPGPTGGS